MGGLLSEKETRCRGHHEKYCRVVQKVRRALGKLARLTAWSIVTGSTQMACICVAY